MLIAITTTPTSEEAEALAESLVDQRLAACVQVLPAMNSVYIWEGKMQRESECLLLIKTVEEKFDDLSEFIKANHSYKVPEIVGIPAAMVSEDYSNWLTSCLK